MVDIRSRLHKVLSLDSPLRVNIILSLFAKAGALLVSFVSVPLLLSFLGKDEYGIWLTIFSVVSWMSFFDLGLGNGLRNHLTLVQKSNTILKKEYISTAYWLLGLFILVILVILQFISYFINWESVFKPNFLMSDSLQTIITICLWGGGLLLITRLIISILQSQKKVGIGDILITLGSLFSLLLLFLMSHFNVFHKLYAISYIFTWTTPVILLIYSIYFFYIKYPELKPSLFYIRKNVARQIFGLGLSFFVAQFLVLVLNQSSNIIITQVLSPGDVTIYYIPMRLFSIISIIFGLISYNLLPYFTEAKAENDSLKMKLFLKRFFYLFFIFVIVGILLLLFSQLIIRVWTRSQVQIPFTLNILHLILVLITCLNSIFSTVLNGIGIVKKQLPFFLISVIVYIPTALWLGQKLGLNGIAISTIIAQLIIFVFLAILTRKIMNEESFK